MSRFRSRRSSSALALTSVIALLLTSCGTESDSAGRQNNVVGGDRVKNGNVTDAEGFGDFQDALKTTMDFLKTEAPSWDPQVEIAKNKCTPSNAKFELINASLKGCSYTDPAPWIAYEKEKDKKKRQAAVKSNYLGWGYQLFKWPRSFKSHNLDGATFKDIDLSKTQKIADPQYKGGSVGVNADFTDATFKGATFTNAKVGGNFVNAHFAGFDVKSLGDLTSSYMEGADYTGTDLSGITLPYSQIGSNFNSVKASNISIPNALMLSSSGVNATFTKAKLAGAQIGGPTITAWPSALTAYRTYSPSNSNYSGADFSGADLSGANLQNVNFTNAKFVNANLSGAKLDSADFTGADLTGADLTGTSIGCVGTTCGQPGGQKSTKFDGATLNFTLFDKASGSGTTFNNVKAVKASFASARLSNADFSMATISGSLFTRATLASVQFHNVNGDCTADGYCTSFANADTRRSSASAPKTAFDTMTGGTYSGSASLKGADFTNATTSDTDFYGVDLSGASFVCTHIESSLFTTGTTLKRTVWAGVFSDANTRMFADQSTLDRRQVACPVTRPELSDIQDDAYLKVNGKHYNTTTTSTTTSTTSTTTTTTTLPPTTTTLAPQPVALVNPTFTANGGGWTISGSTSTKTCGSYGTSNQRPSIGSYAANQLGFAKSSATVSQTVQVPRAGRTEFKVYVSQSDAMVADANYTVTLKDSDETDTASQNGSLYGRKLLTLKVTTTSPNETVTISISGGAGSTVSANGYCQGPVFDTASLTSM